MQNLRLSEEEYSVLRHIASRGGITEIGLQNFKNSKIDELLNNVLISAENRSKEMSK